MYSRCRCLNSVKLQPLREAYGASSSACRACPSSRSSSSSESTHSTLSTLMASSGLNPWIQEARYAHALEHKHRPDGHRRSEHPPPPSVVGSVRQGPNPADQGAQGPAPITSTSTAQPTAVAIFQSTSPDGEGRFVDYNSPQPVFLAPLAGFAPQGSPGK